MFCFDFSQFTKFFMNFLTSAKCSTICIVLLIIQNSTINQISGYSFISCFINPFSSCTIAQYIFFDSVAFAFSNFISSFFVFGVKASSIHVDIDIVPSIILPKYDYLILTVSISDSGLIGALLLNIPSYTGSI